MHFSLNAVAKVRLFFIPATFLVKKLNIFFLFFYINLIISILQYSLLKDSSLLFCPFIPNLKEILVYLHYQHTPITGGFVYFRKLFHRVVILLLLHIVFARYR